MMQGSAVSYDLSFNSVDIDMAGSRSAGKRIPVPKDNIRIFSNFERSDAILDAQMTGRIDRDGLQGGKRIHTGFHSQAGTKGQVLLRNDRGIGNDGDRNTGSGQDPRRGPGLIGQFQLGSIRERWTDRNTDAGFFQLIYDQVPFRAMLDGDIDIEFFGDTDCRHDIICAVRVRF